MKPLSRKAYGSIAHLPGSRLGISDKLLHEGQVRIITEKTRDNKDLIIMQEKLDGSCCSVAKVDGKIVALTRAGYLATTSEFKQHHIFDEYVSGFAYKFDALLGEGERIVGEWMAMAHGIFYDLEDRSPFVAFDIFNSSNKRIVYRDFFNRCAAVGIQTVPMIKIGTDPVAMGEIYEALSYSQYGGEFPEGVVIRVEREGRVDFLGKYVRGDHVCGKYFEDEHGNKITVWNGGDWAKGFNI